MSVILRRAKPPCSACRTFRRSTHTNVIDELEARGFVAALTSPKLRAHTNSPTTIYAGVDPSASSLHVGNLLPLLGLLHFATRGHKSLALIGGATGSIGDPSGRSSERKSLNETELESNVQGITAQVERFFKKGMEYATRKRYPTYSSSSSSSSGFFMRKQSQSQSQSQSQFGNFEPNAKSVQVLNNLDWTKGLGLLEFLRTVGKVARVNIMISRDSVKNRLDSESGISYTEFSYQLLQAYDFHILHKTHDCKIQLGGSDQWGNIVAGTDLIKSLSKLEMESISEDTSTSSSAVSPSKTTSKSSSKKSAKEALKVSSKPVEREQEDIEAYGLTIPLLTTSSGEKFGKSAGNAIWLDSTRTSVSEFYQFFFRTTDEDVERYLKIFTLIPLEKIESIMARHRVYSAHREAQRVLAEEVTELVHGPEGLVKAKAVAQLLFYTNPREVTTEEVLDAFEGDSRLKNVDWKEIKDVPVSKLAVVWGLVPARSHANKLISGGSMYINDRQVNDPRNEIARTDIVDKHIVFMRVGRTHIVFNISGLTPV